MIWKLVSCREEESVRFRWWNWYKRIM